jgi:hypothetical protein
MKLVSSENYRGKNLRTYIKIDIKNKKELYTTIQQDLKIICFEQMLCNKIATAIIGDNVKHYLRIKDLYDLNFYLMIENMILT